MTVELLNIDCMQYMSTLEDNAFDLSVVDPPYGIGNFTQSDRKDKYGNYTWNEKPPTEEYFKELRRVSKERIIWGANYYNCFENGFSAIVWDKMNPHPNMSRCEIASVSWNKRVNYVQIMHYGAHSDKGNFHPCGKPVKLYTWILKNYAKKGDRILDTHLGGGSIAIAAHYLDFDFVGCELDKDYYDKSVVRFEKETRQVKLF